MLQEYRRYQDFVSDVKSIRMNARQSARAAGDFLRDDAAGLSLPYLIRFLLFVLFSELLEMFTGLAKILVQGRQSRMSDAARVSLAELIRCANVWCGSTDMYVSMFSLIRVLCSSGLEFACSAQGGNMRFLRGLVPYAPLLRRDHAVALLRAFPLIPPRVLLHFSLKSTFIFLE